MVPPSVSVIVRTKDRPSLLAEALESLRAQSLQDFEVVLVNDGGRPVPQAVLSVPVGRGLRSVTTSAPHGRSRALNTGVNAAAGTYLAFLDDDDVYLPEHLATLTRFLDGTDLYDAAYTDARQTLNVLGDDGKYHETAELALVPRDFDGTRILYSNHVPLICLMLRRSLAEKIGPFDETLDLYEDWDFLIRLTEHSRLHRLPKVSATYRVRSDGTNATTASPWLGREAHEARARLFRKHWTRRSAETEIAFVDALDHEVRELRAERDRLTAELCQTRPRLERAEADLRDLRADAARQLEAAAVRENGLRAERDELARRNAQITSSLTWRLMAPYWKLKARR